MSLPKIAFFITRLDYGGAEKVMRMLIEELHTRYEIHLILTVKLTHISLPDSIKIFYLTESETTGWRNFAKIPLQARQYRRYLVENNIPLSLSFLLRPNLIAAFTRFLGWRGTLILSERSSPIAFYSLQGKSGQLALFLMKKIFPQADVIVPNSFGAMHALRDVLNIKTRYEVIYNPLDIPKTLERAAVEVNQLIDFERFTFICVGQLHPYKNHQLLLHAFAELADIDCQLLIVGDGEEAHNLKQLTQQLKLENKVIFVGYDSNPLRFMSKSHCFVTATNVEGMPNVLLEALSLGLPVISTDCISGPRELLAPTTDVNFKLTTGVETAEYGLLVPMNVPQDLAAGMKKMYQNSDLRVHYADIGQRRAGSFAKPTMVRKFANLLDSFLKTSQ